MNDSTVILSVDTATPCGGVCLLQGGEVLASIPTTPNLSHSNTLLREIQEALATTGISLSAVDLFAVASGPGSFTGLRIGLATVKALAATLNRPCLGVPTLHAIARFAGPSASHFSLRQRRSSGIGSCVLAMQ